MKILFVPSTTKYHRANDDHAIRSTLNKSMADWLFVIFVHNSFWSIYQSSRVHGNKKCCTTIGKCKQSFRNLEFVEKNWSIYRVLGALNETLDWNIMLRKVFLDLSPSIDLWRTNVEEIEKHHELVSTVIHCRTRLALLTCTKFDQKNVWKAASLKCRWIKPNFSSNCGTDVLFSSTRNTSNMSTLWKIHVHQKRNVECQKNECGHNDSMDVWNAENTIVVRLDGSNHKSTFSTVTQRFHRLN